MPPFKASTSLALRLAVTATLIAMLAASVACGAATPTRPPATATQSAPVQPTAVPVQPTATLAIQATLAPLPTVGTPQAPVTATTAVVVSATATTRATRAATAVPPTQAPKSVTLGGRIVYSLVTDIAPQFHTIWVAKGDGTGASKLLDGAGWASLSPDGKKLAFYQMGVGGKSQGLYIGDQYGGNAKAAYINAGVCCINWSRDANWVVFAVSPRPSQPGGPIMMVKEDGVYKTVVDLKVIGNGPAFSPDGRQIVFSGGVPGTDNLGLLVTPADGTGSIRVLTRDNGGNAQWSPRGDRVVYQGDDGAGHKQVFVINADGSGKKQLTSGKSNDGQPVWSRDGSAIYWRSDQNGTAWAIFVMNADGSNPRKIISGVPPDPNLWGWESLSVGP